MKLGRLQRVVVKSSREDFWNKRLQTGLLTDTFYLSFKVLKTILHWLPTFKNRRVHIKIEISGFSWEIRSVNRIVHHST